MVRFNIKEFEHKNIIIISSELQLSVAYNSSTAGLK